VPESLVVPPLLPEPSVGQPVAPYASDVETAAAPVISPEFGEPTASAPSGTPAAAPITAQSLTPETAATTAPPTNTAAGPLSGPVSLPLPEDVLPINMVGAIALGTLTGAAFIAILITLIGLVRSRFSTAAPAGRSPDRR
jgi:hypothetical protein